jgi:hypothetical protein
MRTATDRLIKLPSRLTIQVDTREKYPIFFPENIRIDIPGTYPAKKKVLPVKTENIKLNIGDYRLKEFPDCCVIERKGAQLEIFKNLFNPKDQIRTAKALRRLSTVEYPYLLIEASPASMMRRPVAPPKFNPEDLIHRLSIVVAKYGLNLLWVPKSNSASARRALGLSLLHLMLGYALREISGTPWEIEEVVPGGGEVTE